MLLRSTRASVPRNSRDEPRKRVPRIVGSAACAVSVASDGDTRAHEGPERRPVDDHLVAPPASAHRCLTEQASLKRDSDAQLGNPPNVRLRQPFSVTEVPAQRRQGNLLVDELEGVENPRDRGVQDGVDGVRPARGSTREADREELLEGFVTDLEGRHPLPVVASQEEQLTQAQHRQPLVAESRIQELPPSIELLSLRSGRSGAEIEPHPHRQSSPGACQAHRVIPVRAHTRAARIHDAGDSQGGQTLQEGDSGIDRTLERRLDDCPVDVLIGLEAREPPIWCSRMIPMEHASRLPGQPPSPARTCSAAATRFRSAASVSA
jgi:hypothetical protein